MNNLMKLAQTQNVFIVDYAATNKFYQLDLFLHFVDLDNFVSNPMCFYGLIHGWGTKKREMTPRLLWGYFCK
jgi:hypothetical protein